MDGVIVLRNQGCGRALKKERAIARDIKTEAHHFGSLFGAELLHLDK